VWAGHMGAGPGAGVLLRPAVRDPLQLVRHEAPGRVLRAVRTCYKGCVQAFCVGGDQTVCMVCVVGHISSICVLHDLTWRSAHLRGNIAWQQQSCQ
jgi:hypothetical protein